MCIYCGTNRYRKIYENHFGQVPKDENNRSYEIHHIDGNHSNNNPTNLKCVSIQEHYDIHFFQKDWAACFKMANRMKISPEERSLISSQNAKLQSTTRVDNGTHNFLGPESNQIRIDAGTHNFLGSSNPSYARVAAGNHNLQGKDNPIHERVVDGSHKAFLQKRNKEKLEAGTHNCQQVLTCPHCNKTGLGPVMNRWHFDKCNILNIDFCG